MDAPSLTIDVASCSMEIKWDSPHDGCSPITLKKFKINGKELETQKDTLSIPMSQLQTAYDVKNFAEVQVTGTTCNSLGCAASFSDTNTASTKQLFKPRKVESVRNILLPKVDKLTIDWER